MAFKVKNSQEQKSRKYWTHTGHVRHWIVVDLVSRRQCTRHTRCILTYYYRSDLQAMSAQGRLEITRICIQEPIYRTKQQDASMSSRTRKGILADCLELGHESADREEVVYESMTVCCH